MNCSLPGYFFFISVYFVEHVLEKNNSIQMICVLSEKQDGAGREKGKDWVIIPFETRQNWPSRSLRYQMMKNLRSIKRLSQHIMISITWIPAMPRNQVCQQFRRISINLHTYWKKSCCSFFHTFIHFKKTETLCHIAGQEHGGIYSLIPPSTSSCISNNISFYLGIHDFYNFHYLHYQVRMICK